MTLLQRLKLFSQGRRTWDDKKLDHGKALRRRVARSRGGYPLGKRQRRPKVAEKKVGW